MDKREAKKLAYGEIGAFVDAEIPSIFEMVETDPDVKHSAADLERILDAMREVVAELVRKSR